MELGGSSVSWCLAETIFRLRYNSDTIYIYMQYTYIYIHVVYTVCIYISSIYLV